MATCLTVYILLIIESISCLPAYMVSMHNLDIGLGGGGGVVLESCAGHASWCKESWYAVLRRLHVSVGHLPLLACPTQLMEEKHKDGEN